MGMTERQVGDTTIIAVAGRLDSATSAQFQTDLMASLERGVSALGMDLSDLEFVSSAGLRVFLLAAKHMRSTAAPMVLFALGEQVAATLKVSGFDRILSIAADEQEALAQLAHR